MLEERFGIAHTTIQIEHALQCKIGDAGSCCR
jgi:hypothetical protein